MENTSICINEDIVNSKELSTFFSEKNLPLLSAKRDYYAHLLDNIGPLPRELTLLLPINIFYAIWEEFYHCLSLVAETARPNGASNFINFILQTQNLGCKPEDVVNPESVL